jgi:hypothetical protein
MLANIFLISQNFCLRRTNLEKILLMFKDSLLAMAGYPVSNNTQLMFALPMKMV